MPSPRKRRMKRALGNVLSTKTMTADQRAEVKRRLNLDNTGAPLLRAIVESHSHSPISGGNTHKGRNFLDGTLRRRTVVNNGKISTEAVTIIENGLIADLSAMDLNATARLSWVGLMGLSEILRFTDAAGSSIEIIAGVPDNAAPAAAVNNGDEIFLDPAAAANAANQMTPRRFLIDPAFGFDDNSDMYDEIVDIINAATLAGLLDIEATHVIVNAANNGVVHLVQNTTGPAGNTAIIHRRVVVGGNAVETLRAAIDPALAPDANLNQAPQIFSGGARAQDATCFYGELHVFNEGGAAVVITATHGLMFISNSNALGLDSQSTRGGLGGVNEPRVILIDPVGGGAALDVHVKAICDPAGANGDTTMADNTALHGDVVAVSVDNGANQGNDFVATMDAATVRKAAAPNDVPVQKVLVGNASFQVAVVTAVPADFNNAGVADATIAGKATQVNTAGGGIMMHWFLADPNPN